MSRGLGDVYKRQLYDIMNDRYTGTLFHRAKDAEFVLADYIQREMAPTSTGGQ